MKESKNRTQSSSAQYKKKIPQKNNNSNCNLKRLLPFLSDKELYKIFSQEFPVKGVNSFFDKQLPEV